MTEQNYTIDATGKMLGRIASEAALLLRGKNHSDYLPYLLPQNKVVITNASKVRISGRKAEYKTYTHYTGYPGGLREVSYERMFQRDPGSVLRHAILGMLPRNKHRSRIIKNLTIYNGDTK